MKLRPQISSTVDVKQDFEKDIKTRVQKQMQTSLVEALRVLDEIDTIQKIQDHVTKIEWLINNTKWLQQYFFALSPNIRRRILIQLAKKYWIDLNENNF